MKTVALRLTFTCQSCPLKRCFQLPAAKFSLCVPIQIASALEMHRRIEIGQGRNKKTITCDNACLAQVDAASHSSYNCIAFVCAQLLEDNPGTVAAVLACYWR